MNSRTKQNCGLALMAICCFGHAFVLPDVVIAKQEHNATPMELSGFSISEAYDIPDDQPLDLDSPILKQLLYRIKNTSPKSRRNYSRYSNELSWNDIATKTEDYRLWLFDRPARLKKIEKRRLSNLSPDEEVKGVYVCYCETLPGIGNDGEGDRGKPFLALSRTIPKSLPIGEAIDEPIRVAGFLFARVSGIEAGDNNEMPVFITDRVAWFPTTESEYASSAHANLSDHGVDVGLFDIVRENDTRPLGGRDAETFFQMLSAVNRMAVSPANGEALIEPQSATRKLGFTELLQNANSNFGEATRITGTVRTCSVISVTEPDIQDRLGVSQYFQLMVFPNLDGARVIVNNKDGTKMDYRRFPITVCCTELPAGMSPKDMERKRFVVDGYFFRFWKYQSERTDQTESAGQVSPLIISKNPVLIASQAGRLDSALLIIVVAIIATIVAMIFGYRIVDRRRKSPTKKILESLPDKLDLTGLVD